MDSELVGSAIRDYYTGKSYKQIAEGLKEEYDLPNEPSKATIYEWVRDYTAKAMTEMKDQKAKTGGHWVADEMQVKVGGKKMWLWNVMDSETRYILAAHLTPRRDARAARVVMRKAALGGMGVGDRGSGLRNGGHGLARGGQVAEVEGDCRGLGGH